MKVQAILGAGSGAGERPRKEKVLSQNGESVLKVPPSSVKEVLAGT